MPKILSCFGWVINNLPNLYFVFLLCFFRVDVSIVEKKIKKHRGSKARKKLKARAAASAALESAGNLAPPTENPTIPTENPTITVPPHCKKDFFGRI